MRVYFSTREKAPHLGSRTRREGRAGSCGGCYDSDSGLEPELGSESEPQQLPTPSPTLIVRCSSGSILGTEHMDTLSPVWPITRRAATWDFHVLCALEGNEAIATSDSNWRVESKEAEAVGSRKCWRGQRVWRECRGWGRERRGGQGQEIGGGDGKGAGHTPPSTALILLSPL